MDAAEELGDAVGIHQACQALGLSRASFYRRRQRKDAPAAERQARRSARALSAKERQQTAAMGELRVIQDQLLEIGCLPKSIQDGLVDFFALKEGRLVFLCWKQGEERIQAWHTLDGGFAGRMPIESFLESGASPEEGPA